jgi:hypothetical protein
MQGPSRQCSCNFDVKHDAHSFHHLAKEKPYLCIHHNTRKSTTWHHDVFHTDNLHAHKCLRTSQQTHHARPTSAHGAAPCLAHAHEQALTGTPRSRLVVCGLAAPCVTLHGRGSNRHVCVHSQDVWRQGMNIGSQHMLNIHTVHMLPSWSASIATLSVRCLANLCRLTRSITFCIQSHDRAQVAIAALPCILRSPAAHSAVITHQPPSRCVNVGHEVAVKI